jgi:hypothetical protein
MLECWLTYRLHLTTSLTSRHDLAISLRYKHPVWKRMHGISGKQRCAAGTWLRELGHVVNSWLHGRTECCTGITTFQQCVLICPPLQNFEKMFLNRVLLYSAFSCFVR